jgi:hypothetical protein
MRVRLKGINYTTKKLASGERKTYWYAWRGGPLLTGTPGSPEFIAAYNEAVARKVQPRAGILLSIIQGYQASEDFKRLASTTRRGYVAHIKRIESEFSDFPLAALSDRRTRGIFLSWRDRIAESSGRRQADYAWSVLALMISWAFNRGLVTTNPCERGGRVYRGSRSDRIWSADDEMRFFRRAPQHLHLPLLLALWTGQRQGDLLRLPWSAYDGKYIRMRQAKTKARIPPIPVIRGHAANHKKERHHGKRNVNAYLRHCWPPPSFAICTSISPSAERSVLLFWLVRSLAICNSRPRVSSSTPKTACSVIVLCSRRSCCIACDVSRINGAASVGQYPLRCDGEQLVIIAARRFLPVPVDLGFLDASRAHGHDGAAQDGNRVVLGKKPDFDVRKFLIQVVQRLASLDSADLFSRLRKFRLVCLRQ